MLHHKTITLNRVDLWNIYKTVLQSRLQEELFSSSFSGWQLDGGVIQQNCEEYSMDASGIFPGETVKWSTYLTKLPFSAGNERCLAAVEQLRLSLTGSVPFLKENELQIISDIFNEVSRGICFAEKSFCTVCSLYLLIIRPEQRQRLRIVLSLLNKLYSDDAAGAHRELLLEKFAEILVDDSQKNSRWAVRLFRVMMSNVQRVFQVDRVLLVKVDRMKEELVRERKNELGVLFPVGRTRSPAGKSPKDKQFVTIYEFIQEANEEEEKVESAKRLKKGSRMFGKELKNGRKLN